MTGSNARPTTAPAGRADAAGPAPSRADRMARNMLLADGRSVHRDSVERYLAAMAQALCHKECADNLNRAEGYLACLLNCGLIDDSQHGEAQGRLRQAHEAWRQSRRLPGY
ncbi:hypothetical protein [Pseudomonas sp. NPDC007930]|uniref:hypothetical protein n=1 Tax=Pseudomonas sp. NPDC007930 TaxID=3364417 RepID=UPI0036E40ADA